MIATQLSREIFAKFEIAIKATLLGLGKEDKENLSLETFHRNKSINREIFLKRFSNL